MYETLPKALKEQGAFCFWKYEERDGRMTKVPYQTSGLRADSTNKASFTDYAAAVSRRAGYDRIGIGVFDDICAIDIDHCVIDISYVCRRFLSNFDVEMESVEAEV